MKLDLNCDLGEGEPLTRTRALMRWITSANVACGGHAGNVRTMESCVRIAEKCGVRLGAHPGPAGQADFGRGRVRLSPDDFELLLLQQVGSLERIARAHDVRLHHVKLHGALYHASENDAPLAQRYVEAVARWWPRCIIYARAGGAVAKRARAAGLRVWEEVFADRGYCDDGTLMARDVPGAVLTSPGEVSGRMRQLKATGGLPTVSGRLLRFDARTVCVHSDTANSVELARIVSRALS